MRHKRSRSPSVSATSTMRMRTLRQHPPRIKNTSSQQGQRHSHSLTGCGRSDVGIGSHRAQAHPPRRRSNAP
eukprot:4491812-Prymnesium_polylepis.1